MTPKVEFYRHQLGEEEAASWRAVLSTLFLTLGPQVEAFEADLGRYLVRDREGAAPPFVVGTSACSMGLLIALRALGVEPGDEVITTPMTFAATASAILHLGARPKLVDVEASTGLIDPAAVRASIGPRTVGILPVHLYGQLADMKALRQIADQHGLFLLEDSAHGIEIERDGVRPGDLSNAAVFSFYATKNMTSGDGGAVVTRDAQLFARMRRLRNHGATKAATERHGGAYQHWDIVELGYKANMTDLDAALLRPQLAHVGGKRALRAEIAQRYRSRLGDCIGDLSSPPPTIHGVPWLMAGRGLGSHHLFTAHTWPGERDALLGKLGEKGIGTAVNYRALHTLTYFKEALGVALGALPIAEEIGDRTLSLPMFPTLTRDEQEYVVSAFAGAWTELAAGRA